MVKCSVPLHAEPGGGYELKRVDIDLINKFVALKIVSKAFSGWIKFYSKVTHKQSEYWFNRTPLYKWLVEIYMKKEAEKCPDAVAMLSFSFDHTLSKIPCVMICDWSYEYLIKEHSNYSPGYFERGFIKRQNKEMKMADAIVALFPKSAEQIERATGRRVYCFGCPVNAVEAFDVLQRKRKEKLRAQRRHILFCGKLPYITGLKTVIDAVNLYNMENADQLSVDVIGITEEQYNHRYTSAGSENVTFYGYLNKGIEEERIQYYELFSSAYLLINPTAGWIGASSLMEALYYGIPAVISHNDDIKELMNKQDDFITFCKAEDIHDLETSLIWWMNMDSKTYYDYSNQAHEFANQYSWKNFAVKLSKVIDGVAKESINNDESLIAL